MSGQTSCLRRPLSSLSQVLPPSLVSLLGKQHPHTGPGRGNSLGVPLMGSRTRAVGTGLARRGPEWPRVGRAGVSSGEGQQQALGASLLGAKQSVEEQTAAGPPCPGSAPEINRASVGKQALLPSRNPGVDSATRKLAEGPRSGPPRPGATSPPPVLREGGWPGIHTRPRLPPWPPTCSRAPAVIGDWERESGGHCTTLATPALS